MKARRLSLTDEGVARYPRLVDDTDNSGSPKPALARTAELRRLVSDLGELISEKRRDLANTLAARFECVMFALFA